MILIVCSMTLLCYSEDTQVIVDSLVERAIHEETCIVTEAFHSAAQRQYNSLANNSGSCNIVAVMYDQL